MNAPGSPVKATDRIVRGLLGVKQSADVFRLTCGTKVKLLVSIEASCFLPGFVKWEAGVLSGKYWLHQTHHYKTGFSHVMLQKTS